MLKVSSNHWSEKNCRQIHWSEDNHRSKTQYDVNCVITRRPNNIVYDVTSSHCGTVWQISAWHVYWQFYDVVFLNFLQQKSQKKINPKCQLNILFHFAHYFGFHSLHTAATTICNSIPRSAYSSQILNSFRQISKAICFNLLSTTLRGGEYTLTTRSETAEFIQRWMSYLSLWQASLTVSTSDSQYRQCRTQQLRTRTSHAHTTMTQLGLNSPATVATECGEFAKRGKTKSCSPAERSKGRRDEVEGEKVVDGCGKETSR